jgi:hypothetical protein
MAGKTVSTVVAFWWSFASQSINQSIIKRTTETNKQTNKTIHFRLFSQGLQINPSTCAIANPMQSKSLPINQETGQIGAGRKKNIQEKSLRSKARIIKKSFPDFLARVHLFQPRTTLVQSPIDSSSDRQSSTDNGADADEEAREGL